MDIAYRLALPPLPATLVGELAKLSTTIFGAEDRLDGVWRIEHMPDLTCFEARRSGELVGFKLGYAATSRRYYSWLGGVHPSYRRSGIARELMCRQHDWLLEKGYAFVETEIREDNHSMARLNTSCGFRAIGIKFAGDNPVIIYRKCIDGEKV